MKTGERIRLARISAGLTQTALAKKLNVAFSTLNRWEHDKQPLRIESMEKLSAEFDKPIGFWLEDAKPFKLENSLVGKLDNNFRILNVLSRLPSTLPDYSKEDIGGTIKISQTMFGYSGDYCIHLNDDTMEPNIARGSTCIIHNETLPQDGGVFLVYLPKKEGYVISQVCNMKGTIVFNFFNKHYAPIKTNNYRIVGRVIGAYHNI